MKNFHVDFEVSTTTVGHILSLADASVDEGELAALTSVISGIVRSTLTRWSIMRSYDHLSANLADRAEWGFIDLMAARSGFDSDGFGEAGSSLLSDIADWLREGNPIQGDWGMLELREDGAILA